MPCKIPKTQKPGGRSFGGLLLKVENKTYAALFIFAAADGFGVLVFFAFAANSCFTLSAMALVSTL